MATAGTPDAIPIAEWERVVQVNVLGIVRGLHAFLPHMLALGNGHVVFTTSSLALVIGLAQSVAGFLEPRGIGVTLFAPGLIAGQLQFDLRPVW